jgi:hypothetical protein
MRSMDLFKGVILEECGVTAAALAMPRLADDV